jgi:hypothetical protein
MYHCLHIYILFVSGHMQKNRWLHFRSSICLFWLHLTSSGSWTHTLSLCGLKNIFSFHGYYKIKPIVIMILTAFLMWERMVRKSTWTEIHASSSTISNFPSLPSQINDFFICIYLLLLLVSKIQTMMDRWDWQMLWIVYICIFLYFWNCLIICFWDTFHYGNICQLWFHTINALYFA